MIEMQNKIKQYISMPVTIRVITVALSFVSNILINRSLGLALKGQYTTILTYANFMQMALNLGVCYIYPILLKNNENEKKKVVTLIWMQTFLLLLPTIVALICSNSIQLFTILLMGTIMVCNSQIIFLSLIDDIKGRNRILLFSTLVFIMLNIICIMWYPNRLFLICILYMIKLIVEIVLCSFKYNYFVFDIKQINKQTFNYILKYGLPTALMGILISCNYNFDVFMLNWLNAGDVEIGKYGVAYSLSNMLWILPDAFKELIYNKTVNAFNKKFIDKCIGINVIFCGVICIGFFFLGRFFLELVYGEEYVAAFNVTLTLFIGIIPMVAFKLIHPIYVNNGKSIVVVLLLSISVLTNISVSYFLIPNYGAFGAAIASVASYLVCGILFYLKFSRDYKNHKEE